MASQLKTQADAAWKEGRIEEALERWQSALESCEEEELELEMALRCNIALAYEKQGRWKEVIEFADISLAKDESNLKLLYRKAVALFEIESVDEGEKVISKLKGLCKEGSAVDLASSILLKKYKSSITYCDCWINNEGKDSFIFDSAKSNRVSDVWTECLRCAHEKKIISKNEVLLGNIKKMAKCKEELELEDNRQVTNSLPLTIAYAVYNMRYENLNFHNSNYFTIHLIGNDGLSEMKSSFRHLLDLLKWNPSVDQNLGFRDLILINVGFTKNNNTFAPKLAEKSLAQPLVSYLETEQKTQPRVQLLFNFKGTYSDLINTYQGIGLQSNDNPTANLKPHVCMLASPVLNKGLRAWYDSLQSLIRLDVPCIVTASSQLDSITHDGAYLEPILICLGAKIIIPTTFNRFPIFLKAGDEVLAKHAGAFLIYLHVQYMIFYMIY